MELKYLTAAWAGDDAGEHFEMSGQGAQDIRAYDPAYWSRPAHGRATNADAFRIYEDQVLSGSRA